MYVTGRQAAAILGTLGLGRGAARRVLAAGLAGEPLRLGSTTLYEEARVRALADRRLVDETGDLPHACRFGVFVARIDPTNGPHLEAARGPARLSIPVRALVGHVADHHGAVPMVATVSHFVVAGADLIGTRCDPAWDPAESRWARQILELRPPGPWFEHFRDRLLYTPPGNPWLLWRCPFLPGVA